MTKWADYLIFSVHYNTSHSQIIEVKTRQQESTGISKSITIKKRSEVLSDLNSGDTYITITFDKFRNSWHKGEEVQTKKVGSNVFITTDPNETTNDNLGELPEYRGLNILTWLLKLKS